MAERDIIMMSQKELKRLSVIHKAIDKQIAQVEAADILNLCIRQIGRITKRVKQEGDKGIIHKSRGRPSNRAIASKIKAKALRLCQTTYKGFNPTLASEKLEELNKIFIHPETLRLWFINGQIQYKRRKAKKYRSWRERKHHFGQMLQLDGSHHEWFERRGPKCVFMGYIDDATGKFFGRFYDYEGTKPAMDSFQRYINKYGIPQSVYLDKHTTYKSTKKPTIEEELENKKAKSQFERALEELGVEVIHAQSPQAKGRIERAFNTHQDRLVKEMRLKGIRGVKEANTFLSRYYIPKHNRKFTIPARNKANLHRALPKALNLDKILCIKQQAALRNDFTVAYEKKLYQVLESTPAKKVMVEERVNGAILILYKGKSLKYRQISQRPISVKPEKQYTPKPKKLYIPPKDHPYKSFKVSPYTHIHSYPQKEESSKEEKELLLVH